jgi:hypothetical protein
MSKEIRPGRLGRAHSKKKKAIVWSLLLAAGCGGVFAAYHYTAGCSHGRIFRDADRNVRGRMVGFSGLACARNDRDLCIGRVDRERKLLLDARTGGDCKKSHGGYQYPSHNILLEYQRKFNELSAMRMSRHVNYSRPEKSVKWILKSIKTNSRFNIQDSK